MELELRKTQPAVPSEPQPRPPLRRKSLHTQVVEKLRQLISRGDIAAGERINELQIAAALGVSRTPMREAVKLLASEGLLELLPGRGARVRRLSPEEIRDHFEVIGALERHAVEIAVGKMTAKELAELLHLHDQMRSAFASGDRRSYFVANQKAHGFFVRAAGSATLEETHQIVTKRARHDRPVTLASPQRWRESLDEHEDLIAAVKAADPVQAGVLMLRHVRRTGAALAEIARLSSEP